MARDAWHLLKRAKRFGEKCLYGGPATALVGHAAKAAIIAYKAGRLTMDALKFDPATALGGIIAGCIMAQWGP
jgi:hypothetical protein